MAKQRFLNNFTSTFIAAVKDAPSSGTPETELDYGVLRISDGAAGSLINPTDGDYYLLTAFKRSGSVESNIEVMRVTGVNNATPGECRITVQRAQEGTSAKAFVAGDYLSLRITKGTAENFSQPADLATKEPAIAAPVSTPTEKYWRGDKTWRDFFSDVRAATLTGLSTATNAVVAATDTVLAAIGKLQAQVSAKYDKTGGDINGPVGIFGLLSVKSPSAGVAGKISFQNSTGGADLQIGKSDVLSNWAYINHSASGGTLNISQSGAGTINTLVNNAVVQEVTTAGVRVISGSLGYGVGSGGAVVQATSKSTAVTLNKPSGQITMNNGALGANATVAFSLNNTFINGESDLLVKVKGGSVDNAAYQVWAFGAAVGSIAIAVRNIGNVTLSESIVLEFKVMQGANS